MTSAKRSPDSARGSMFESLQFRNFRLFFGGQLISQIGNWLTRVAQTLLVLHIAKDGLAIGLLAACQFGPVLVLGPWAGLVADRSDKRKLLIKVQSAAMLQSFALGALAVVDHPPLAGMYAVALLGGLTLAFDNPARRSFVVELVPAESRQNAVSLNNALMMSARIVGPALGGLLVVAVGFAWTFFIDAFTYIAVIIGLQRIRPAEGTPASAAERSPGQIRAGLRYMRSVPELYIPLTMMTVTGTLAFNLQVALPLLTIRGLGGGDGSFTAIYSILSIGSLAGALVSARRRTVDVRYVVITSALFGVAMVVFSASPTLPIAYALAVPVGLSMITYSTAASTMVQLASDEAMRGRVLAVQGMVIQGTTAVGGPMIGAVCDRFGGRAGILVGGVSSIGAAAFGARSMRTVKQFRPTSDDASPIVG